MAFVHRPWAMILGLVVSCARYQMRFSEASGFFLAYADFHACHVQAALALVARVCGSYEGDAALVPIGSDR